LCKNFRSDFVCVDSGRVQYTCIYWVFKHGFHNRCLALARDSVRVSRQPSWNRGHAPVPTVWKLLSERKRGMGITRGSVPGFVLLVRRASVR
jgi:hypothetical protein